MISLPTSAMQEDHVSMAAALAAVRERVPGIGPDRVLVPELETAAELVRSGATDAGYERAADGAAERGVRIPMGGAES
ncbi:MAG TPA: hypothetical protein VK326_07240 [Solirubrobacterales bacterium]|nr:hypothetical protein [Solirubrobacterales bacterium]